MISTHGPAKTPTSHANKPTSDLPPQSAKKLTNKLTLDLTHQPAHKPTKKLTKKLTPDSILIQPKN
jgi:hypothetical protein